MLQRFRRFVVDDAARPSSPPSLSRAHLVVGSETLWGRLGIRLEGDRPLKGERRQFGGVEEKAEIMAARGQMYR
jgi:hypothetical protein